jgi:hypothetical protein
MLQPRQIAASQKKGQITSLLTLEIGMYGANDMNLQQGVKRVFTVSNVQS